MNTARSKPKRNLFLLLLPVAIFGLLWLLVHLNPLQIKNQTLSLENVPCASESALKEAAHLQDQSILFVNSQVLQRTLEAKFLCINQVVVSKTSLNSIKLDVIGRQALLKVSSATEASPPAQFTDDFISQLQEASSSSQSAVITPLEDQTDFFDTISSNHEELLVDATGLLFEQATSQANLADVMIIHPPFKLGEKIDPSQVKEIEEIWAKLNELSLPITSFRMKDATVVIKSQNPEYLLFNLDGAVNRQLASLQLILKQITMDPGGENSSVGSTKPIQSIDFRFDKPVLVYASK